MASTKALSIAPIKRGVSYSISTPMFGNRLLTARYSTATVMERLNLQAE
jgi:hypothetical protein